MLPARFKPVIQKRERPPESASIDFGFILKFSRSMMKHLHMFSIFGLKYVSLLDTVFRQRLIHRYVIKAKTVPLHNKTPRRDVQKIGGNNPRIFSFGFKRRRVILILS
jgi:hypothetical protein